MTAFGARRKGRSRRGNKARDPSVPPVMGAAPEPSLVRRLAAAGSLAAVAAGTAWAGLHENMFVSLRVGFLALAGVVGLASVGLLRRSVVSQVLARAVAWVVLLPMGMSAVESLTMGRAPELETLFFGGASAAALLLARPMLHADAARAEFGPVAYRRWFLAGAVAQATVGIVTAMAGAGGLLFDGAPSAVAVLALAATLVASAVGVVRMRSWGVLLGLLTSIVTVGAAALAGDFAASVGLALAALPGFALAAPIAFSRLRPVAPVASPSPGARPARVAALDEAEPPFRARIDDGACDIPAGHVAEPLEAKDPRSAAR